MGRLTPLETDVAQCTKLSGMKNLDPLMGRTGNQTQAVLRILLAAPSVWTTEAAQTCQVGVATGLPASNQHPFPPHKHHRLAMPTHHFPCQVELMLLAMGRIGCQQPEPTQGLAGK